MRRVIGMDIHRTFGEVVIWENGVLRRAGRVDMTRMALEGFGKTLEATDEVVIEATGNSMAVSRALSPFVARVVIANPLQVKAIAHAPVKTDKVDAGTLANLYAAGYLPEIWTPDAATERLRRLVARRHQIVRHRTRVKNEVHAILAAHLVPKCPHADLFNQRGRAWLARQVVPEDERTAIERNIRELDRPTEDQTELDRAIASSVMDDASVRRLMTIMGVNLTVCATIAEVMTATNSQPDTVWGVMAGALKKLGLDVTSEKVEQRGAGLQTTGRFPQIDGCRSPYILELASCPQEHMLRS